MLNRMLLLLMFRLISEHQAFVSSTFQPCHYHHPTNFLFDLRPVKSENTINPFLFFEEQYSIIKQSKSPGHIYSIFMLQKIYSDIYIVRLLVKSLYMSTGCFSAYSISSLGWVMKITNS